MKKRKFLCIVLSFHMLFCMGGCVQAPRETETKARFCPENDIITYEPVDFDKTVITIGTYAPAIRIRWSLPLRRNSRMWILLSWNRPAFPTFRPT